MSSDEKLLVSAFYHPDDYTLTLVLINLDNLPRQATLRLADQTAIPAEVFEKYSTTRKKNVKQEEISSVIPLTIEPLSITTLYSAHYPLDIDLKRIGFTKQPENIAVTAGHPVEFEAIPLGPYPWRFDFQWEITKPEDSEWQMVGDNIPYLRINNVTLDHDQSRVRLRLTDRDDPERMVFSYEATLNVKPFKGVEIPLVRQGSAWSEKQSLDNLVVGRANQTNHTATAQLAYDEKFLYVRVLVPEMSPTDSTGKPWVGDGAEFYLDTRNSKMQVYGPEHYQWFFGHTDTQNIVVEAGHYSAKIDLNKIQGESTITPEGWQIIAQIPWDELDVDPIPGMYLGFDVHLIDGDAAAEKEDIQAGHFRDKR